MSEEIIPNDGRAIDINSPTAKSIIEGVIPKAIRTWTIFRNTNNTLEGIESVAFAMWQVALEEIEKESDHIVFMSDTTINLIRSNNKRLQAENKELKEQLSGKTFFCENCEKLARENEELKHRCEVYHQCNEMIKNTYGQAHKEAMRLTKENKEFKQTLEEVKTICNQYPNIKDRGNYQEIIGDTPVAKVYKIKIIVNKVLK